MKNSDEFSMVFDQLCGLLQVVVSVHGLEVSFLMRSEWIITEKSAMKRVINEAACSQVSTPA